MNPLGRLLFGALFQLGFLALAVYLVVAEDALPGAAPVVRFGLAGLSLAVGMLYGEVLRVRQHLGQLLRALQGELSSGVPRDDRMAVDLLVAALGSDDAAKREAAHKHLVRLTGQRLPADAAAWQAWWKQARPTFPTTGAAG